jgi:hypothetical protein
MRYGSPTTFWVIFVTPLVLVGAKYLAIAGYLIANA